MEIVKSGHASDSFKEVCRREKDVPSNIGHIPLNDSTGGRKQKTAVADIQTTLRIIVHLPCRVQECFADAHRARRLGAKPAPLHTKTSLLHVKRAFTDAWLPCAS